MTQDEEYQFKVEQANFRKDQYLTKDVERSTKKRRETSEGSEGHGLGQGDQERPGRGEGAELKVTMMQSHETKEASSSGGSGQRSADRMESSILGDGALWETA